MSQSKGICKSYNNRSDMKPVSRGILHNLETLNKSILNLFGLEENDNLGKMQEPNIQELDNLLTQVDYLKSFYRELV